MNKTRENIKWAPFESLFHSKDLEQEITKEKLKCSKPTLSEDTLIENEKKLLDAYHTQAEIKITYYYNGYIYEKKSSISFLNYQNTEIFLKDHTTLYFEQILKIIFL